MSSHPDEMVAENRTCTIMSHGERSSFCVFCVFCVVSQVSGCI